MKKTFLIAVLLLVLCGSVYSETLRYYDLNRGRYVTVDVTHIGWMESYQTISGAGTRNAKIFTYTAIKLDYETQWRKWELMASRPVEAYHSLRDVYNVSYEFWRSHPILGVESSGISGSLISVDHVPNGRSTPYWFDEDGDLHTFMKLYMLKP